MMGAGMESAASDADGIAVIHRGRRVMLKWHCLRRRVSDPQFGLETLCTGLRLGASMEIDLRMSSDSCFAVLHDDTLDRETDGVGPVADLTGAELARLHYDDSHAPAAELKPRPLLLVDDIARLLNGAHPDALLQLDMKDDLATVGERGLENFTGLFGDFDPLVIVSGDSSDLTFAIGERLPGLKLGLEPSFRLIELYRSGRKREIPAQLLRELRGPIRPSMVYLNWELVLAALQDGVDLVAMCHDEGAKVDAWTFTPSAPGSGFTDNEWRDFLKLLELGVDQITTDEAIAVQCAYCERIASG